MLPTSSFVVGSAGKLASCVWLSEDAKRKQATLGYLAILDQSSDTRTSCYEQAKATISGLLCTLLP